MQNRAHVVFITLIAIIQRKMATLKLALDTRRAKNAHVDPHADITCFGNFILLLNVGAEITRKSSPHFLQIT